eukprot:4754303-Alexandrium_andersonii.AAC.1
MGQTLNGHLIDPLPARARLLSKCAQVVALDLPLNPLELQLKCTGGVLDVVEAAEERLGQKARRAIARWASPT